MNSTFYIRIDFLLVLVLAGIACADNNTKPQYTRAPAQIAEPGLTFGKSDRLLFEYSGESNFILDKTIIPVTLPKGTTPILLKVCNGEGNWGFIIRITDVEGNALTQLQFSVTPQ